MITEEERQKMRKKRQRARKRKRVRKKILLIIAAIIILLAVFIVTVKLVNPNFDIASYLPSGKAQQAVEMIDSKLFNKTTTTSTTLPTTQKETTTKARDIKKLITITMISAFLHLTPRFRVIRWETCSINQTVQ